MQEKSVPLVVARLVCAAPADLAHTLRADSIKLWRVRSGPHPLGGLISVVARPVCAAPVDPTHTRWADLWHVWSAQLPRI